MQMSFVPIGWNSMELKELVKFTVILYIFGQLTKP